MGPIDLDFDVTDDLPVEVTGGKRVTIAGWLFFPDDLSLLGERPVTMVLTSGGSYDKRYHHAVIPDHPGYSAAEHLAGLGNIVLLTDHLGMGGSGRVPDQKRATRFIVAQANDAAVRQFRARLAAGTLHPALPLIAQALHIGGGHSMGAMLTTIQQARHRTYDAIMVMGYTAQGVHGHYNGRQVRTSTFLPANFQPADYTSNDRSTQRENFHWDDVPAAVLAADDALAVETPSQIGVVSIYTGIIAAEAAQIEVPVFFGQSERDVSPDPAAESVFFRNSPDFTRYVLPRAAHCQTFAGTRHLFWNRMHSWAHGLAG